MIVETVNVEARRETADVFNSAVASAAIGAAWEVGALDVLQEDGKLVVTEFAKDKGLDARATGAMFHALATVGVVERHDSTILTGRNFAEVYRARSLFHWLSQGSGQLFDAMPRVLRRENRNGKFYTRDAAAISFACREINARFFDPVFWSAMRGLDFEFGSVADLGSGSGERLLQIVKAHPRVTGIGIDIAAPALEMSAREFAGAGLSNHVTFVEADVRELTPRPEFEQVELLTCFMMGHDFWPRDNCVATLRRLRAVFPNARRFLLGDTGRSTEFADHEVPVFTLGFEVGHALMGVYLPTIEEWHDVFADGGWHCRATHVIETPAASAVFELE